MTNTIYLTGYIPDWDNKHEWQDYTKRRFAKNDDLEFIDAYRISDIPDDEIYDRSTEMVENAATTIIKDADGLLARWNEDSFLAGTMAEITLASQIEVPVAVWNSEGQRKKLSPWLDALTRGVFLERDKSVKVLEKLMQ